MIFLGVEHKSCGTLIPPPLRHRYFSLCTPFDLRVGAKNQSPRMSFASARLRGKCGRKHETDACESERCDMKAEEQAQESSWTTPFREAHQVGQQSGGRTRRGNPAAAHLLCRAKPCASGTRRKCLPAGSASSMQEQVVRQDRRRRRPDQQETPLKGRQAEAGQKCGQCPSAAPPVSPSSAARAAPFEVVYLA